MLPSKPSSDTLSQSKSHLWRQLYLQRRMSDLLPRGIDASWVWPHGERAVVDIPEVSELDALDLIDVLPVLMGGFHPKTHWSDTHLRRLRGAHYTPQYLVDEVLMEFPVRKGQTVCDPATGSGVWLRSWLVSWLEGKVGDPLEGLKCLYGVDIDPLAVAVCRFMLWEVVGWHPDAVPILEHHIRCDDSCLVRPVELWSERYDGFDLILGNPPWLFLSGRGSPVARLKQEGKIQEAEAFQRWVLEVSVRYSNVSKGCKDLSKWFVGLGLAWLRKDGAMALVLPDSVVRLPKYCDVRSVLSRAGSVTVWMNSSATFAVTTNSCVVFLRAGRPSSVIRYWDRRRGVESRDVPIVGFDWPVFGSEWAERCYTEVGPRLGDWVRIAEGVHDIFYAFREGARLVLAVDDRRLGQDSVVGTRPAYMKRTIRKTDFHRGERIVLRKTGAVLCAARVNTVELAVAHQNVYILKLTSACPLSITKMVELLNAPKMSELYQNSPLGVPQQAMAQFRISALRTLPIPLQVRQELGVN